MPKRLYDPSTKKAYDIPDDKAADYQSRYGLVDKLPEAAPPDLTMGEQAKGAVKGLASTTVGPLFDPQTYKGIAQASRPSPGARGIVEMALGPEGPMVSHMLEGAIKNPGALVDAPAIKKNIEEKKYGEAGGRGIGQLLMLLSMFGKAGSGVAEAGRMAKAGEIGTMAKGGMKAVEAGRDVKAVEEMATAGKSVKGTMAKNLNAAAQKSAHIEEALGKEEQALGGALGNEAIPTHNLRPSMIKAMDQIREVEKIPGMPSSRIESLKALSERINDFMGAGSISWSDARQFMKDLGEARTQVKGSVNAAFKEIHDVLEGATKSTAKAKGMGERYNSLLSNWKDMYQWRKAYANILQGITPEQAEAKMAGGTSKVDKLLGGAEVAAGGAMLPTNPYVGSGVAMAGAQRMASGGTRASARAITAANKAKLTTAHRALGVLARKTGAGTVEAASRSSRVPAAAAVSETLRANQPAQQ